MLPTLNHMRVLVVGVLAACICPAVSVAAGPVTFEVTAERPERPPNEADQWIDLFALPGVGATALGLAAPPLYASGLILGGVTLLIGGLTMHGTEGRHWQQAVATLEHADLASRLRSALERRAATAWPPESAPSLAVTVTLNAWGLVVRNWGRVAEQVDTACFIASLDLVARRDQATLLTDRIVIGTAVATPGAPPPQCAKLSRFAADDGRLVQDTAAEAAEVLAALVIERLRAVPP
jgi:hypothetical protein